MPLLRRSNRVVKESAAIESQVATKSKRRPRRALTDVSNTRGTKAEAKSTRQVVENGKTQIDASTKDNHDDVSSSHAALVTESEKDKGAVNTRSTRSRSRTKPDSEKQLSRSKSEPSKRTNRSHSGETMRVTRSTATKRACDDSEEKQSIPKVARRSYKDAKAESKSKSRTQSQSRTSKTKSKKNQKNQRTQKDLKEETSESKICSDFLPQPDYGLVRLPFDSSKYTPGIAPHDRCNHGDALSVSDYATDIYQRLYNAEAHTHPDPYMHNQKSLSTTMRAILVDWLVEVHMKFHLVPETLYLCVNIIDRYLSMAEVERGRLQLVGVTSLLIACKYEEIYPPEVRDCVYITDRAYTRQDVLDMERDIVQALGFRMTVPTGYPFLQRFLFIVRATKFMKVAANYYMERLLQEYSILKFRPSLVAAAVVCLAVNHPEIRVYDGWTAGPGPGIPDALINYTGYSKTEILEVAEKISVKVREEVVTLSRRELVAVKRKYEAAKYMFVSLDFEPPDIEHILED